MNRPTLEVADVVRAAGNSFWEKYGSRLAWPHRKVLDAIVRCRTAALGGHLDQRRSCGHQAISYNSCRNRHCPRCQGNARARWLAARSAELLPVPYFHIVFTLPHEFSALILQNKRLLYDLLFRTSAATPTCLRSSSLPNTFIVLPTGWAQSISVSTSCTCFASASWLRRRCRNEWQRCGSSSSRRSSAITCSSTCLSPDCRRGFRRCSARTRSAGCWPLPPTVCTAPC